jgi:hypothetical protein
MIKSYQRYLDGEMFLLKVPIRDFSTNLLKPVIIGFLPLFSSGFLGSYSLKILQ